VRFLAQSFLQELIQYSTRFSNSYKLHSTHMRKFEDNLLRRPRGASGG